jgi:hypothetical protein
MKGTSVPFLLEKALADTFFNPISIPNVTTPGYTPSAAEPGYLKILGKDGIVVQVDEFGVITALPNSLTAATSQRTFAFFSS